MRKIEITVQFRGRPDLAGFDASVVWRGVLDKMRLAAIPEIELQGFPKAGLISFYRKVVLSLSLLDQVSSKFSLRQQRIPTDILALNLAGLERRRSRLDLVIA